MEDIGGWLRANAHRLRTLDPPGTPDSIGAVDPIEDDSDLAPLLDIVGDARVVAIGEATHRVHEFYQIRHRLTRFLAREAGFTAFAMESAFPEGLAVHDWVAGGAGDVDELRSRAISYHMGECAEMRDQLNWFRSYGQMRFYGMDTSDSSASARPAIEAAVRYLDRVDPDFAASARAHLLPLFAYLPEDRSGHAWAAPAIQAYQALDRATRYELTARISALVERMAALRVEYLRRSDVDSYERALRCAVTGRHTDGFLQVFALGEERTFAGSNIRDLAMAENVGWILEREQRIVIGAANGHIQRWPFSAPPIIQDPLTMMGEHLAAALGDDYVTIGTAFGGGTLALHRPIPDGPPGHTEPFTHRLELLDEHSLDELLATAGMPYYLLDLRQVPSEGPVAERFGAVSCVMTGGQATPVDPLTAFDAMLYVDTVTPWHHT